jgi:hypothetical protein
MLAMIAPDQPAQIAVTSVAIIRQTTALAMVLLWVSVNYYLHKKAPFGALYFCYLVNSPNTL